MDLLKIDINNPNPKIIAKAAEAIHDGKIICYPTETIYGLGGDVHKQEIGFKINEAKRRDKKSPFIILLNLNHASRWIKEYDKIKSIAETFWPGPLSMIVNPQPLPIYNPPLSEDGGLAVRVSNSLVAQAIITELDTPIISTSANISGSNPIRKVAGHEHWLSTFCSLALDGGEIPLSPPSTLIDVREFPEKIKIVRGGAIPAGKLWDAFKGTTIESGEQSK